MDCDYYPDGEINLNSIQMRERERMVETIMEHINGLLPGQSIEVVAHDPDEEEDKRQFTIRRLDLPAPGDFYRLLRHAAEQAGKNQWLNVLAALNQATDKALQHFDTVLKGK